MDSASSSASARLSNCLLASVASEGLWIGTEAPIEREARRARFLQHLSAEGAASFVAVEQDHLVGSLKAVMGTGMDAGVVDLGMHVAADSRGRGVGSALMEACLRWGKGAGAHKVALTVWPHNHAARALYAKFGFLVEGTLRRAVRRRRGGRDAAPSHLGAASFPGGRAMVVARRTRSRPVGPGMTMSSTKHMTMSSTKHMTMSSTKHMTMASQTSHYAVGLGSRVMSGRRPGTYAVDFSDWEHLYG